MKKAQKIKDMIQVGKTNAEIVKAVPKATLQQIYNHRYLMKKNANATTDATPTPALTPNQIQIGGEHYKKMDIQPWDAIHEWGLGFFSGNVVKYVARHREKDGVEDLKKARHYLDKLIELMEKQ